MNSSKILLTALIVCGFTFICQSQNWDKRYESAKFESRQGLYETYTTVIIKENGFSQADFYNLEDACAEENYFFRLEYLEESSSIRFYHKSNVDGYFIKDFIRTSIGVKGLSEGEMAAYKFN